VPPGRDRNSYLAELRRTPGVASAEPSTQVLAAAGPSDPYYATNQAPYLNPIGAPAAWEITTGRDTVIVAVVDSGTDLNHPDLQGQLWENKADSTADGIDDDGNGCIDDRFGCRFINLTPERAQFCGYTSALPTGAVADDHGRPGSSTHSHGTIVAGIAGARGDNATGISGVAWDIKIMTVKVLDCGLPSNRGAPGGDMDNVARGIQYARQMGARIINLSLTGKDQTSDLSILRDAIAAAQAQGVIVVAAAGNRSSCADPNTAPGFPAAYTQFANVIAVAASDNVAGNTWACYSNYGAAIDFAAPGNDIVSTVRSDLGLSNPYGMDSGTSFSAPIVSGMFALMLSRNTRIPVPELLRIARASTVPAAPAPHGEPWAGAGVISLANAVSRIPLTITGAALHDWKDVPPNSEVRVQFDGVVCGTARTAAFGVVARFAILVSSESETPGCGAIGKTAQIFINGAGPAQPAIAWGGRNEDIGLENRDLSTISPLPGPLVVQSLGVGWNNVAHLEESGNTKTSLGYLPLPWSEALFWNPELPGFDGAGRFSRFVPEAPPFLSDWTNARKYDAFWVNAPAANIATVNPNAPNNRALNLQPGWNNFVYTGANRSVAEALSDVERKYTAVYLFENATQKWTLYTPGQPRFLNDFGGLSHLRVYWIFMTSPGTLTMR
jgi:subtilisin family serine protease